MIPRILRDSHVVAVLGAHSDPARPAFYVPDYLHERGYRVIPVNPSLVGQTLWGEPVRASLDDITEPVDVVDVFRRSALVAGHLPELRRLKPKVVWMQTGVRDDAVAEALQAEGIEVVQDRCMLAEHRRLAPA